MRTFARRAKAALQTASAKSIRPSSPLLEQRPEVRLSRHLQRAIGNQAVQRLFPATEEKGNTALTTPETTRFSHDDGQASCYLQTGAAIQPKLEISRPGDRHEREAEEVADHVMHLSGLQLPRAFSSGEGASKGQTEKGNPEHGQSEGGREHEIRMIAAPSIVQEALNSPGQALDSDTQEFMEQRLGHDLSRVRVHHDTPAAVAARTINAVAYTVGNDIVFGKEAYSPASSAGKRLLAHELAHVIQQGQAGTARPRVVNRNLSSLSAKPERSVQREPAPARAFAALTLSAIKCFFPDDQFGDEVYITVNGQRVWGPVSMDRFDVEPINRQIEFSSGPLVIRVFDQESWPLSDDLIGSVVIPLPGSEEEIRRAPTSALLATNGAYELYFQVHRI